MFDVAFSHPLNRLRLARERAFTLIELLVVILIIGILLAVALPSFLGQTQKAQNSVALQQLNTALTEAKSDWTLPSTGASVSGFTTSAALVSYLKSSEPPSTQWAIGPDTAGVGVIDAVVGDTNTATFCTESADSIYFCAATNEKSGLTDSYVASTSEVIFSYGSSEDDALAVLGETPTNALTSGYASQDSWPAGAGAGTNPSGTGGGGSVPSNISIPTVSGTALPGHVLTAGNGSWTGSPNSYSYQWESCNASGGDCSEISEATSSTYTVQSSDSDNTIAVAVSASNGAGASSPVDSALTVIPGVSQQTVSLGTAYQASTLQPTDVQLSLDLGTSYGGDVACYEGPSSSNLSSSADIAAEAYFAGARVVSSASFELPASWYWECFNDGGEPSIYGSYALYVQTGADALSETTANVSLGTAYEASATKATEVQLGMDVGPVGSGWGTCYEGPSVGAVTTDRIFIGFQQNAIDEIDPMSFEVPAGWYWECEDSDGAPSISTGVATYIQSAATATSTVASVDLGSAYEPSATQTTDVQLPIDLGDSDGGFVICYEGPSAGNATANETALDFQEYAREVIPTSFDVPPSWYWECVDLSETASVWGGNAIYTQISSP